MKPLVEYSNYRVYLNDLIYGPSTRRGFQTELAKAMGCQAAYLSQVLKDKAELTEDHALKLVTHLRFSDFDSEYFMLLLRMSRAATPELVQYLDQKRLEMARHSHELSHKIKAELASSSEKVLAEYFVSWIPSTIHIATSCEKFQSPQAIARHLGLQLETVECVLRFLEQSHLVENRDGQYVFAGGSFHLPRSSPLDRTHQTNRRIQALQVIQKNCPENIHFSSLFTADQQAFLEVKKMILQYIEESHRKIHSSGTDNIYGMCLDVFEIN